MMHIYCGMYVDLCGTPGYLAPELLRASMYDKAPGYGRPVDMYVHSMSFSDIIHRAAKIND